MQQMFEQLVNNLNTNHVIKPLLRREAFILELVCEGKTFYLELRNGVFSVLTTTEEKNICLKGEREVLQDVLHGKVLLRHAKKKRTVEVHSSLRKLLLLESILHLVNVNEPAVCKQCS
ncbi:hypothetical protein NDK25_22770 [Niallia taxi]|uniref:hypothetical protein n=1 Tax=Niallia taxi TaxID=2499688 RepID=UPI0021A518F1|nr:hypothetical protein [Niallia taxi]MCT2346042.1 hypothetical protein [Niallia taxi]MDE5055043.1 hypothetical protein [Niallia taxi]